MPTINAMSNYLENKVLVDNLVNTPCFIALFLNNPSDTDIGTEVSGGAYTRKPISFSVVGNLATNSVEVGFTTATTSWGALTHFGIYDGSTGGNLLFYGFLESSSGTNFVFTVNSGDSFKFPIGSVSITME